MSRNILCAAFSSIVFLFIVSSEVSSAPLYDWEDPNSQTITEEVSEPGVAKKEEKPKEIKCPPRLTPFKPNYVVYQWARDDEFALRVHYSYKYRFRPVNDPSICSSSSLDIDSQWYLSYTGVFDFYAGTRDSGPVVNRISNPALHYREGNLDNLEWIDYGFEHRSDGQVNEPSDPVVQAAAQQAYDANDHKYFDTISQGSNYVSVEAHKKFKEWSTYASVKGYLTKDSQVTWGALKNSNVSISDYDILNFVARTPVDFGNGEFSFEYIIGNGGIGKSSANFDFLFYEKCTYLPWYVRLHLGPFQTLSNYTVNKPSLGIGLKFIP